MYFTIFIFISVVAAVLSAVSLRLAFLIAKGRKSDYRNLSSRYKTWYDPFIGRARIEHDRIPDGVVQAGLIFNKKTGHFEPNGRLSEEALDKLLYN